MTMENIDPSLVFNRTRRLVGGAAMDALSRARVIIFGVGGVGSCSISIWQSFIKLKQEL